MRTFARPNGSDDTAALQAFLDAGPGIAQLPAGEYRAAGLRIPAGVTLRVYGDRAVVADGVVPEWVIDGSPELRPSGALISRPGVRTQVAGVDLVRDGDGNWYVLEDNLRVPSGIAYAMQNRRLTERAKALLEADGFTVLVHGEVPSNDGGLALGQAAIASVQLGGIA
jgi:hypothetical protein